MDPMANLSSLTPVSATTATSSAAKTKATQTGEFKQKFAEVFGETMYGVMFKALRESANKSVYFNGGRAEQIFGQQLDQLLAEKMARRDASKFNSLSSLANLPRK
jgi:hypothetical protein